MCCVVVVCIKLAGFAPFHVTHDNLAWLCLAFWHHLFLNVLEYDEKYRHNDDERQCSDEHTSDCSDADGNVTVGKKLTINLNGHTAVVAALTGYTVVEVKDAPAFLANRIGFQFINEAMQYAQRYQDRGGIDYVDGILGSFTGRTMAPLTTADFVGLDVHKAIVDNLYANTCDYAHSSFVLPSFCQELIDAGLLGRKAGAGLYKMQIDENGKKTKNTYLIPNKIGFSALLKENYIGCSTVMLSRVIFDQFRFSTDFYHEDYCLWLDLFKHGYKATGLVEPLVNWRLISGSRSYDKRNSALNRWKIYRRFLGFSIFKSSIYFACYVINGLKKYS